MKRKRVEIAGYITHPSHTRSSSQRIQIFVNGRMVTDRGAVAALVQGYRGRLMKGRFPLAALFASCRDDASKLEKKVTKKEKKPGQEVSRTSLFQWGSSSKIKPQNDDLKGQKISQASSLPFLKTVDEGKNKDFALAGGRAEGGINEDQVAHGDLGHHDFKDDSIAEALNSSHKFDTFHEDCRIVGQVMGTYIIVENSDGVELIDQHAAHERIMYEQLKKRSDTFKPPSQQVIVPHVLDFNFSQSALFEQMIPELGELGFEIEPFGEKTFAVKSVPAIIDAKDVGWLLHDMVDAVMESGLGCDGGGIEKRVWLDACLILMACHHSVRANQALTGKEMGQLVRDLDLCENAFYCPHGRPIRVAWSPNDLQHMFKRIV